MDAPEYLTMKDCRGGECSVSLIHSDYLRRYDLIDYYLNFISDYHETENYAGCINVPYDIVPRSPKRYHKHIYVVS